MKFSEFFKKHYYDLMLKPGHPSNPIRNRADSFLKVFQLLESKNKDYYKILETGCMRRDHGALCFGDDGCSSYLFDQFLNYNEGELVSVDISRQNVEFANSYFVNSRSKAFCSDSVAFLDVDYDKLSYSPFEPVDLLYLDSFDITREDPGPSQRHHLREVIAANPYLKKGSIVVVDDHNAFFTVPPIGKGNLVKEYMGKMGATKIFEDYQIGWQL